MLSLVTSTTVGFSRGAMAGEHDYTGYLHANVRAPI
jgi:hypothetical protein